MNAKRKLVRGRHADHLCRSRQPAHPESFAVDWNGDDPRPRGGQDVAQWRITRFLDGDGCLAGRYQDACEQVESLLRARGDHDFLRRGGDSARKGDVASDRFAQRQPTLRFAVARSCPGFSAQRAGGKPPML